MRHRSTTQAIRCKAVHAVLEAYLVGELNADTRRPIEAHLAACPHCRKEMALALEIGEVLQELPRPQPPPEIFDQVAAYVRSHPNHKKAGWLDGMKRAWEALHLRPLPVAVISVCLIGFALFGAYQQHQKTVRVEVAARELTYALSMVNYAMQKTELAVKESLPTDEMKAAPHTLRHTLQEIDSATTQPLSQAIHKSVSILNTFNAKEKD